LRFKFGAGTAFGLGAAGGCGRARRDLRASPPKVALRREAVGCYTKPSTERVDADMKRVSSGYSSRAMHERRGRILQVTRRLLAEQGIAAFNLDELAREADVAKRTVYYKFGSREGLIAAAILDYFEEYEHRIPYHASPGTLQRLLERMVAIGERNLGIRNYVAAIVTVYFGPDPAPEIQSALHEIARRTHGAWIEELGKTAQLHPWIDPEVLIDDVTRQRYGIAHAWTHGDIADGDMIERSIVNLLTYLLGAVRGRARREIEQALRSIAEQGAVRYVAALADEEAGKPAVKAASRRGRGGARTPARRRPGRAGARRRSSG
jgi:AcrR family transcriptional regulator